MAVVGQNESIDTISISTTRRGDIAADRAVLWVTIEGASLIAGQSALHKAREVKALADALRLFGLKDSDIELAGVAAVTSSGTFGKSSAARYTLQIRVADLEHLPEVIGIVTEQKNTSLQPVQWGFPDGGAWRDEWLDDCLQRANARSHRVARGLGVRLIGVHRFIEQWSDQEASPRTHRNDADEDGLRMSRARMTSEDLGVGTAHTKSVALSIAVQYLVGRFEAPEKP